VPLVTAPTCSSPRITGLPWRGIPCPSILKATSFSAVPSARARAIASEPMNPVSSLQHQPRPASIGLRSGGAKPAGDDAGVEQLGPDRRRHLGVEQQLDPVLAGVAGAAGERRPAADLDVRDVEARRQLDPERAADDAAGMRALDGEHRVAIGDVADERVELATLAAEPGEVGLVVGGVGDNEVTVAAEPVGEEVVDHATVLVAEDRVLGAADLDLGDVVREHPLQEGERPETLDLDLPHVGDVEHPGVRPHRRVLLADPLVGHRHRVAGEGDDLRPELDVLLVEGRLPQGCVGGHAAQSSERTALTL